MRTLDQISAVGLRSLAARCPSCEAAFEVSLKALDLPGDTGLDAVTRLRPIACPECSTPAELASPDDPASAI